MIVVEGPDGGGKSTLVSWLVMRFSLQEGPRATKDRAEIWRHTRSDTWLALHYELMCKDLPLVWDRLGPFSDPVYATMGIPAKRAQAFTPMEQEMFAELMDYIGLVIVCLPPLEAVKHNVHKHDQLKGVVACTPHIWDAYLPLADHYIRYDYTKEAPVVLTDVVQAHLNRRKERERLARNLGELSSVPGS